MHIGSVSTGMKKWQRVPGYWFDSRLHYFVKNHGTLYATGVTMAHLSGGFLYWLRCSVTRRPRNVPHYFLLTMVRHDLPILLRAIFPKRRNFLLRNPFMRE